VTATHVSLLKTTEADAFWEERTAEQGLQEWFGPFRFPGNESTTRKDGIPFRMEKGKLGV